MSNDEEIIATSTLLLTSCACLLSQRSSNLKKRNRRWWMLSLNKSRRRYDGTDLLADLRMEPSGKFENFCRMSAVDFEYLLNNIGARISKTDTNMRKAIPVQERLAVTLRFLATGDSYQSLSFLFKFSPQLISSIVPEVCQALIDFLKDRVKLPNSRQEWENVAERFDYQWNFPHCIGALDGKHVLIQAPYNSGTEFYNYKNTFSIVLMALVDADYCFMFADVGCQGRISDGGVFRNTKLFKKIEKNELHLPPNQPLPGRQLPVPYIFVADDAFSLCDKIMKPYPGSHIKGSIKRIYNYRVSRARRIVENAFGILAMVFRILRTPIALQPENVATVIFTCVLLHNFLRKSRTSRLIHCPHGAIDFEREGKIIPGTWRQDVSDITSLVSLRRTGRKATAEAQAIREEFAKYFMTTGKVEWQDLYS